MENRQNRLLVTRSDKPSLLPIPRDDEFGPQLNFKRLRARLYEERIAQGRFAAFLGMSGSTFGDILLGREKASIRTRYRLAYVVRAIGLDDGSIVTSVGVALPPSGKLDTDGAEGVENPNEDLAVGV